MSNDSFWEAEEEQLASEAKKRDINKTSSQTGTADINPSSEANV